MKKIVRYSDLTEYEKCIICNGCGGKGSWVRPPNGYKYKLFCDQHDFNYQLGGSLYDKIKSDVQLLIAIVKYGIKLQNFIDVILGMMYFVGISIGGHYYFNWDGDGDTLDIDEKLEI